MPKGLFFDEIGHFGASSLKNDKLKTDNVMKKTILILVSLISCIALHAQRSYTLNFALSDYNVEEKDGVVSIVTTKGAPCYLEERSAPALPYFPYRVLRPANTSTGDFSISYEKELIYQNVDIEGNPAILSTNEIPTIRINTFKATKSSESPVILGKDNSMFGYNYSFFKVSPFIYDYSTRSLYFASHITISLNSKANETKDALYYITDKAETVKRWMVNPDELEMLYPEQDAQKQQAPSLQKSYPSGNWDYVIITSQALEDAFQPLIDWKTQKGLRSCIVTTESIVDTYPNFTMQKKLKVLISYLYSCGAKWILLGGDNFVVPIQYCEIKKYTDGNLETTTTPCDMWYGCLDYEHFFWDVDGDGIVGESGETIVLDQYLYVTRAPVSNETEANYFVQKVLRYEKHPEYLNNLSRMLFTGAKAYNYIGSISDTHYKCEYAYNTYINNNWSYGHDYLYDTGSNISGYSSISPDNFQALLNSGSHFIHHESHALANILKFSENSFWTGSSSNSHSNNTPFIFVTSSCCTNAIDSVCISKFLMNENNGAIAYWGSSRNGITYNSNNVGPSLQYDSFYFNNLFTGKPTDAPYHFGAVAAETKNQFVDYANSSETDGWRYLTLAINPLGDPEMPIYTSIPSTFNNVSITTGSTNYLTVSTGGISGCTIALVSTDGGVSYFNVAKNVSSYTFTGVTSNCYVTITKHNYKPYTTTIQQFSIQGSGSLCGDDVFWINNLSPNCTVNWHFENTSSQNNSLLSQNSPSQGMCTLSNPNSLHIHETLIAEIKRNNVPLGFAKLLVSTGGNFSASFNQPGGTQNGYTYPTITNTLYDNSHQGAYELREMTFTSSDFSNCNLSYSEFAPSQFYVSENTLHAIFPSVGGCVKNCTIVGRKTNECKIFQINLHIQPSCNLSSLLQTEVIVSSIGKEYVVSLKEPDDSMMIDGVECNFKVSLPDEWDLTIVNANTGATAYTEKVKGQYARFNTSGWKPGVYIIACEVDGKVISKKTTIK